jgi:transcriptional regulator with XRE-family HTH domain
MNANATSEPISPLRAARQRAGLSMERLAVAAGISRATLYWAEKAPQRMSDRTARAVAGVLGIAPEALRS